ncbi:MAG: pitrilysin family protein, partial [Candidatus Zixiibacteriota bacterium]
ITESGKRHAEYIKEVLDNGLTLVVKSNPDSRVFALNVLGKNRSASELPGKDGITDFVNRMIEKGTTSRSAIELTNELSSIGANVTLYDNPWIPYDDRYTTRQFSFMKFETIDQYTDSGLNIFADMIMNPAFDSTEIEKVRTEIMGLLGRDSGSTYKSARNKFYAALLEGTAYAKTIEGNFRTVGAITREDLIQHHHRIYSPENMIITVGTDYPAARMMTMLKKKFRAMERGDFEPVEASQPAEPAGIKSVNQQMDKEQVYIYIGHLLPAAGSPDAPGLSVTSAVLSDRLQKKLREEKGWAYSVGASAMLDKNFGWLICSMGTQVKNYNDAKSGIIAEIERLKTEPPTEDELEQAINSIWGSSLTARLSRINQAYYMGVNEYLGLGYDYDDTYINKIRSVTAAHVSELAGKYFDTKNYVIATAGNI